MSGMGKSRDVPDQLRFVNCGIISGFGNRIVKR